MEIEEANRRVLQDLTVGTGAGAGASFALNNPHWATFGFAIPLYTLVLATYLVIEWYVSYEDEGSELDQKLENSDLFRPDDSSFRHT